MKFDKGMVRDMRMENVPEGAWSDARNIVVQELLGSIANEEGTIDATGKTTAVDWATNQLCVGSINIPGDRIVVFLTDEDRSVDGGDPNKDEVGILDVVNKTYTPKVISSQFNLDPDSQITGTSEINYNGDIIVAWRDGTNPPRFLNIDTPPYTVDSTSEITDSAKFDLTNVWPDLNPVNYEFVEVTEAGGA